MDTNKIKRFATEARNILKVGIKDKIQRLGFDMDGNVAEENRPQFIQGGSLWKGQIQTEGFYYQWKSLFNRIQQKNINYVCEEATYTWFNRLCAIRILQKNNLCANVLDYVDIARTPVIVDEARQGHIPPMNKDTHDRLTKLLDDDNKVREQFALLITAWCQNNTIINECFGSINDYTELLLPNNILVEGGFMDMLNHTDFITDENFQSPELIGWLYQFFISERKDEVYAKKGKIEADEIPAATQIFTPNWIVKYMVQNTVGRIYLDNNPAETNIPKKWKYLVEPSEKPYENGILKYNELTEIKVADLACGSGHILNECFDLLYELYIAEGYSRAEAIENIFRYNLTGIDIDNRAKQLATFALLLKACQKDAAFADKNILPNILSMPKPWDKAKDGDIKTFLHSYFQGQESNFHIDELTECFKLMQDADSLGSIMKFNISDSTRLLIKQTTEYWCNQEIVPQNIYLRIPSFKLIFALSEKYHALVMNPPYMGGNKMNDILVNYVNKNYKDGKADFFSTFMLIAFDHLVEKGKCGMITKQSWMFLSSFEKLRKSILDNYHIENMLHLGPHTFDELSGEVVQNVAFVISNSNPANGIYIRLVDGKTCANKGEQFYDKSNHFLDVSQSSFRLLMGCPIAYWVSKKMISIISKNSPLGLVAEPRAGLQTSDNNRFLRIWHEVSFKRIGLYLYREVALKSDYKWFGHNKGGHDRRWYGNNDYVINFQNEGKELKYWLEHNPRDPSTKFWSRNLRNYPLYFMEGLTWSSVSNKLVTVRYSKQGFTFDTSGPMIFLNSNLYYLLGFMNSKVFYSFAKLFSQGLSIGSGHIAKVPFILERDSKIERMVKHSVSISKSDWDAHETSWDFEENELLALNNVDTYIEVMHEYGDFYGKQVELAPAQLGNLEWLVSKYKTKWGTKFLQLHKNEEELNRQFIEIYGLQDELTPDVSLEEITILQQDEISISSDNQLVWHEDAIIKQLISYAVGCMMGRYSIDKKGLVLANQGDGLNEYQELVPNSRFGIDDDGIIPLMSESSEFNDNATLRFKEWLKVTFGEDTLVENLNYVEHCLNKTVEQYFIKDFWKGHIKMYQKRPIYWLFSSKKGTFQVITYMHRMNAYTVDRIRTKYLLPFIEHLKGKINKLDMRRVDLSTKESKQLQILQKQLDECREYDERLQVVAEQAISFDIDDGIVVNYAKFGDILQKIK